MSQTLAHEPTQAEHGPVRQHYNITLAVLIMSAMAYGLQQTLVAPALPAIQTDLGVSTTAVTYVLTAFLLAASVATPILGRLGDMFGKKRLLVWTLISFAAGSLICALATSIGMLIVGRVVQGGGAAVFPLAFGIIRDEFPREKIAGAIGLISATIGVGGAAGVVLSGVIVDHLDYSWVFWLGLAFTSITVLMTKKFVPESRVLVKGKVDWAGAALLSAGMVALLIGVSEGNSWGWADDRVLGLFGASVLLLVFWCWFENRHPEPLVDMAMMRRRAMLTTNLAGVLIGFGMYSSFILFPKFVQTSPDAGYGFGSTVTQAGLFMLPSAGAMLIAGPLTGYLTGRYGPRLPLMAGSILVLASFIFLAAAHSDPWMIYLASGISGIGIGFAFASMPNLIIDAVEPSKTGVATGMNAIMRTVGGAIGGQICAAILMGHTGSSGVSSELGFTLCFVVLAIGLGVALLCVLAIPTRAAARRTAAAAAVTAALVDPTGLGGTALFGQIRRADGAAVPAAVLTVMGENGREIARTRADAAGHYRVDLAQPGRYLIVAAGVGQDPQAAEIHVNGHPAELELTLPGRPITAPPAAAAEQPTAVHR